MIAHHPGVDPTDASMVQCRVTDEIVERSQSVVEGSRIVVEGVCEGKHLNQARLEECEIVSGGM